MISERLSQFIQHLGLTPYQFEKAIGVGKNAISTPIKNGTTIGSEIIGKIFTKYPQMNLAWLIVGTGDMINEKADTLRPGELERTTVVSQGSHQLRNSIIPKSELDNVDLISRPNSRPDSKSENLGLQTTVKERLARGEKVEIPGLGGTWVASRLRTAETKTVSIDIVDVRAAANWSGVAIAEEAPEILGTIELPTKMLKAGNHKAFTVIGDSMEPTLYTGDYVVGRLIEKADYDQIRDHFIYIVVTREGVVIKRLINRLRQRGEIRCRSDNRKYSAYNVNEEDIVSIWEAKAKLSFNFTNEQGNLFDMYHDLEERIAALESFKKK